jgi:hypothetical protein
MNTLLEGTHKPGIKFARSRGPDGTSRKWHLLTFLVAFAIIFLRRPDALLHAQFYGEDGAIWFAEAYNWGPWKALFWTYNGYIHMFPRLIAAGALVVPFRHAPLIENLAAIALQAVPVNIMLSRRSTTWGPFRFRASLAGLYLVLPNIGVMAGTITESQWVLALCAFLLLVAVPPRSTQERAFDLSIFVLCILTGPFCIVLLPIVVLSFLRNRTKWDFLTLGTFFSGSLIQIGALTIHDSSRYRSTLGAGADLLLQVLGGQIYLGTLLGANMLSVSLKFTTLLFVTSICTFVVLAACSMSPVMRRLSYFSAALFAASLASPIVYPVEGASAWEILAKTPGAHYWFFPSLAFGWSIAWCLRGRNQVVQIVAACMAFLMIVGVIRDFKCPAFQDDRFADYAHRLDEAPKNTVVVIPQNPPGWKVKLIKH